MSGTRFGLEDVAGYDPLQLSRYHNAVASSNGRQPSDRHFTWVERAPTRLLRRLGVRYYVADPALVPAEMPVVLRTPQAIIVRDDGALPLARVNRPGSHRRGAHPRARPRSRRHRDAAGARPAAWCWQIRPIRVGR